MGAAIMRIHFQHTSMDPISENSDRFHWRYFGEEQHSQASRSSTPVSSMTPIEEPSNARSSPEASESNKKKKGKKYDT